MIKFHNKKRQAPFQLAFAESRLYEYEIVVVLCKGNSPSTNINSNGSFNHDNRLCPAFITTLFYVV
ncbi:hypothetical protein PB1_05912 [Bacillus methanolicus PB1]|uniref:Uncharacterized protein n=1 Tax=Bacillus methanolicus PB1 TaxID=997296 RepID=I3E055_BACMT|nr:hypothetical protein PB1_05912 [Bacillus methanolicus PB1]